MYEIINSYVYIYDGELTRTSGLAGSGVNAQLEREATQARAIGYLYQLVTSPRFYVVRVAPWNVGSIIRHQGQGIRRR